MAHPDSAEPGPDAGIDDIQADIEQTRKELGDTVGALSAKLDVKERAKNKASETKERVIDTTHSVGRIATQPSFTTPAVALVLLGALGAGIVIWRRRR